MPPPHTFLSTKFKFWTQKAVWSMVCGKKKTFNTVRADAYTREGGVIYYSRKCSKTHKPWTLAVACKLFQHNTAKWPWTLSNKSSDHTPSTLLLAAKYDYIRRWGLVVRLSETVPSKASYYQFVSFDQPISAWPCPYIHSICMKCANIQFTQCCVYIAHPYNAYILYLHKNTDMPVEASIV